MPDDWNVLEGLKFLINNKYSRWGRYFDGNHKATCNLYTQKNYHIIFFDYL